MKDRRHDSWDQTDMRDKLKYPDQPDLTSDEPEEDMVEPTRSELEYQYGERFSSQPPIYRDEDYNQINQDTDDDGTRANTYDDGREREDNENQQHGRGVFEADRYDPSPRSEDEKFDFDDVASESVFAVVFFLSWSESDMSCSVLRLRERGLLPLACTVPFRLETPERLRRC